MAKTTITETFSQSEKNRLRGEQSPDPFRYGVIPPPLRIQIIHIWNALFGEYYKEGGQWDGTLAWTRVEVVTATEGGLLHLLDHALVAKAMGPMYTNAADHCRAYFRLCDEPSAIDMIGIAFSDAAQNRRTNGWNDQRMTAADAIADLNARFLQHGIGYHFTEGRLVRVDSAYLHANVVLPAITLLRGSGFKGAEEEFLSAHLHYRAGEMKAAVVDAAKAFESTLKSICVTHSWEFDAQRANAKTLVDLVFEKGLIPSDLQSHFSALRTTLESGLPTVRNRKAGHGQGKDPIVTPQHMAAYALHLAATNIVFLVESSRALPQASKNIS